MPRKIYIMNQLLFENLKSVLDLIESNGLERPYYSVTDDGQLVSLTWDTTDAGKSVIGSMKNKEVVFTCYIDDIYETRATFALPQKEKEAVHFVKTFLKL
jgi:hypothetical protein